MAIQHNLLRNLRFEYGKVTYTEEDPIYTYVISFEYTAAPSLLTITYDEKRSTVSVVMTYIENFVTLAKNDLRKTYQILMYLDVFYATPTVSTENGNMILTNTYTFEPGDFDYKTFSGYLSTIEKMTHEVNHMLSTKDFESDEYQNTIYGGGMFELMTWDLED
ncbi:hypothetical protein GCM10008932_22970 [Alkalibacterium iburiense]|uniref:Uncharacterized protein n=1 Tax=Alkalibacterium iburiense TaxID=290589 RepID=A0ABP3HJ57_9LACT